MLQLSPAADTSTLLAAALAYAARGWHVFPCRPRAKEPLTPHGHLDATTDPAIIQAWWRRHPTANVAIACRPSGLLVLDEDPRHGGDLSLSALLHEHGSLPTTVTCQTGGGGTHHYFRHPDSLDPVGNIGDGLDVKSAGYVLAPPSVHPTGAAYEWEASGNPDDVAVAVMPPWLLTLVAGSDRPRRSEPLPEAIPQGRRNHILASLAGTLRARGLTEPEMLETLQVVNAARCRPPLPQADVQRIAASVSRYEPGELVSPTLVNRNNGRKPHLQPIGTSVGGEVLPKVGAAELCQRGAPHLDYLPFLGRSGYVVRGWTTLVAGYPKSGKTELIASWCLEQSDPILYFTEEPESVWAARLAKLPGDWSHVFLVFALGADPADILATIINSRESIIVIDTVRNLLALHDETDNSEVARVLAPHITACRTAGKTLMLLHHIRKGGGSYGEGITGGHAFLGIVDAAIEILREQNLGENCRHIRGWGRVAPIPELLYELLEDGTMKALGDPMAVHLEALQGRIAEVLNGDWQTTKEVWEALEEPRPSKEQVRLALAALVGSGSIRRDPVEDKRGATYRFCLAQPHFQPIGTSVGSEVLASQPVLQPHLQPIDTSVGGEV